MQNNGTWPGTTAADWTTPPCRYNIANPLRTEFIGTKNGLEPLGKNGVSNPAVMPVQSHLDTAHSQQRDNVTTHPPSSKKLSPIV